MCVTVYVCKCEHVWVCADSISPACSASSGCIFSRTWEYWTFAFTHAANGAAAALARFAFWSTNIHTYFSSLFHILLYPKRVNGSLCEFTFGSKEALFLCSSSSTLCRISWVMFRASNVAISSLTPLLAKKLRHKHRHRQSWQISVIKWMKSNHSLLQIYVCPLTLLWRCFI